MIHTPEAWTITARQGSDRRRSSTPASPGKTSRASPSRSPTSPAPHFMPRRDLRLRAPSRTASTITSTAPTSPAPIAQTTHNALGVTGVAYESTIMPLKVLGGDGRGSVPGIANAIRYAADHGAHVINMSLGGPAPLVRARQGRRLRPREGRHRRLRRRQREAAPSVGYPAGHDGAVAVAADRWQPATAPGTRIGARTSTSPPPAATPARTKTATASPTASCKTPSLLQDPHAQSDYMWLQGTSMASPHAAGVAALIVSRGITNPDEVERILKKTAKHPNNVDLGQVEYGAGVIDALAAVDASAENYAPERGGLAGLLGLAGLASARRRRCRHSAARRVVRDRLSADRGCRPRRRRLRLRPAGLPASPPPPAAVSRLRLAAHPLGPRSPCSLTLMLLGVRPPPQPPGHRHQPRLRRDAPPRRDRPARPSSPASPAATGIDRLWLASNALLALALARRTARA